MNPPNNNPQTTDLNLQKLEQDLKDLEVKNQSQPTQSDTSATQSVPSSIHTPPVTESIEPVAPTTEIIDNSSVPPKKTSPLIAASIVLVVIALLATVAYVLGMQFWGQTGTATPTPATACTMEAKLCPDGSYVGRTGPKCEFSACPTVSTTPDSTINWKTYTHKQLGFTIKYPPEWSVREDPKFVEFDTRLPSDEKIMDSDKVVNYAFQVSIDPESGFNEWTKYSSTTKLESQAAGNYVFERYIASDLYSSLNFILKQNGKIFRFMTYPYEVNVFPKSLSDNINQILSTFKLNTGLSEDLIKAVKEDAVSQNSNKITVDSVIIGDSKVEGNYAMVAFNYVDGGGAIDWLVNTSGVWKVVLRGQEPPPCSTLKSYNFPSDFSCNQP